jgi:hypothetical protein
VLLCRSGGGPQHRRTHHQSATVREVAYDAFLVYMRTRNELLAPIIFMVCQRLSDCEIGTRRVR